VTTIASSRASPWAVSWLASPSWALSLTIALLSHSFAVGATAVDCTVDVVAALILFVGLKVSTRKSRKFPFGLYKVENVLQLVVALLIFLATYQIAQRALAAHGHAPSIAW
jgi:divalent metal cation (Fe/Co/Zn/Cd) transporter